MTVYAPSGTFAQTRRGFVPGRFYTFDGTNTDLTGALVAGRGYLMPFTVDVAPANGFNQVSLEVVTTSPGSTVDLAVYGAAAAVLDPALPLTDWGAIDTHTATGIIALAINWAPAPGRYWLGALCLGGTPTVRTRNQQDLSFMGEGTAGNDNGGAYLTATGLAAWPATNPAGVFGIGQSPGSALPKIMLRAA